MNGSEQHFETEGYELAEQVASDRWGELFRAEYVPHRRTVLFRAFAPGLSQPEPWELTVAEIRAWARIDHPSILQPLDWGKSESGAFLAMEMPLGEPLEALLRRERGVAHPDPGRIFERLLVAVEAARLYGVLHLGLSATNVWVCPDGSVMVSDFGLWYVASEFPRLAIDPSVFAAPEQLQHGRASAASDVYSLGLILVALEKGMAAAEALSGGAHDAVGFEDAAVQAMVSSCLALDPLSRPRSAGELIHGDACGSDVQAAFRDCPVCRLKKEIGHDFRLTRRTLSDRFRDLDQDLVDVTPSEAPWRKARQQEREAGSMLERGVGRLFPWIAIASLAVLTIAVWWLAFRQ